MYDQELALRFFAFKNDVANYVHDLTDFLTDYMEKVSDSQIPVDFNYDVERATFKRSFLLLKRLSDYLGYGNRIFGSMGGGAEPRGQFSVYHFEALSLGIQSVIDQVDPNDEEQIAALANVVRTGKADREFLANVGGGKNYRNPLLARISYFSTRFSQALP